VGAADPLGTGETLTDGDSLGTGETLTDGDSLGAGDELTVGEADGDTTGDAVAVALAAAAADMDGAAAGDVLGADVAGAEAVGEVAGPDTAGPECVLGICRTEAATAMPPAADAASSPTTMEAIVSGRASRRRRRSGRPRWPGAGGETGDSLADVTVLDRSWRSGSSRSVREAGSAIQRSVGGTAAAPAANIRSRAVGRWPGSLARQRWISPRTSAATRSRFTWR
jgi:hypothetical protein